ncbi:30S ribosomal protein S8 [Candidatus Woesearchaeota archaeon]|nr:30S ribosomal protein S8 [Candidatus Woesearchaeota archaeon]
MSLNDPLANAMSSILNSERIGTKECIIKPAVKFLKDILAVMQDHRYLGGMEEIQDGRGNLLRIHLLGKINQCGVIKPRYAVKKDNFEKFEKRYLPAKDFGLLLISTPKGLMTHHQAKELKTGGRLIAYVY